MHLFKVVLCKELFENSSVVSMNYFNYFLVPIDCVNLFSIPSFDRRVYCCGKLLLAEFQETLYSYCREMSKRRYYIV